MPWADLVSESGGRPAAIDDVFLDTGLSLRKKAGGIYVRAASAGYSGGVLPENDVVSNGNADVPDNREIRRNRQSAELGGYTADRGPR